MLTGHAIQPAGAGLPPGRPADKRGNSAPARASIGPAAWHSMVGSGPAWTIRQETIMNLHPHNSSELARNLGKSHFLRRVLLPVTLLCLCALLTASCHGGGYRGVLAP